MTQPDDALTLYRENREQHITHVEVLDKVKALALLPDDMHATKEIVADYFEVPVSTLASVVEDHREELESNGYRVLRGSDLRIFADPLKGLANLVGPKTRSLALFNRRAILNVAMLLRDSGTAREVRTYLLDAESNQPTPDWSTSEGQIELLSRMLEIAKQKRALEITNAVQAKELVLARPKAVYVDTFVSASDDLTTVRAFAAQLGLTEPVLREYLRGKRVIYRRLVGHRRSKSKGRDIAEHQWLAYAGFIPWFALRDQPEAPPMHNGQVRQTMYVTPVGKAGIRNMLDRHPITADPEGDQ